jgi:hypothetical protein
MYSMELVLTVNMNTIAALLNEEIFIENASSSIWSYFCLNRFLFQKIKKIRFLGGKTLLFEIVRLGYREN